MMRKKRMRRRRNFLLLEEGIRGWAGRWFEKMRRREGGEVNAEYDKVVCLCGRWQMENILMDVEEQTASNVMPILAPPSPVLVSAAGTGTSVRMLCQVHARLSAYHLSRPFRCRMCNHRHDRTREHARSHARTHARTQICVHTLQTRYTPPHPHTQRPSSRRS